jgi:hypothetical protein
MRRLVVFILLLVPSLAMAQSKPRLLAPLKVAARLGGAIPRPAAAQAATPDALWKKIQAANAADLRYAKALADSAGSPGAKLRSACYAAWIVTIDQTQGTGLKDAGGNALTLPDLHVFSSFEQVAEVAEALQPTGPLMAACAPAWTALRLSAAQFFTLAVSGAVGLSALGVAIP